jgi:thiamine biosynthesis lipoprotein ApbE
MKELLMRRQTFGITWVLGVACLGGAAFADEAAPDTYTFHETNVLGTSMDLVVTAKDRPAAEAARAAVLAEVERLRQSLSAYDPAGELARVNASTAAVRVSPALMEVLALYEGWQARTGGMYSAGTGAIAAAWKAAEAAGREPAAADLAALAAAAGGKGWELDAAGGTVRRLSGTINVDSLGKGYIVTRAARAGAGVPGVEGLLLNIGGDVSAVGTAEPGRTTRWTVPVADPRAAAANAAPIADLRLTGLAVASSGSAERGYTVAGRRYSHLIDPRTARPLEVGALTGRQVVGATAIAADNETANALATSLCLLSVDDGLALVDGTPGAGCLLVLADGSRIRSEVFRRYEVPREDAPLDQSTVADAGGDRWPAGHGVAVALRLKPLEGRAAERPYVAVWVEDARRQHVATLAVWGNDKKWLPAMTGWWKYGKADAQLAATTRATRPAGKYTVAWDGRDQRGRPVPAGTYTVWVETAFEHGGHVVRSAALVCGDGGAAAEIAASPHFDPVALTYGPAKE